jgi:hypothetical protein
MGAYTPDTAGPGGIGDLFVPQLSARPVRGQTVQPSACVNVCSRSERWLLYLAEVWGRICQPKHCQALINEHAGTARLGLPRPSDRRRWSCRGRSQSSVARSAIQRTRAQRAHFTVTLRGERMPGTEDGPRPVFQARPSAQRYGGYRRPAEAGRPTWRRRRARRASARRGAT